MFVHNKKVPSRDKSKHWEYAEYSCIKAEARYGQCEAKYNTIMTSLADDAAWKYACDIIRDPQKLTQAIEALKTPNPASQHEKPVEVRKKEIEDEIAEYMDMIHTSKTDAAKNRAKAWIKNLKEQLLEIEAEEKILQGITKNWQAVQDEILRFEKWCERMREKLETATFAEKRTAVEYLGVRLTVWKYGSRPRMTMGAAPPNILETIAGMELNPEVVSIHLKPDASAQPLTAHWSRQTAL